ncbi:hypothetical protein [Williamsia soli]|uniref:hypothetical protein n=1 Tax=Williamsia soli TaxID=364929 RepID=UPI001A9DA2E4|nr:hypothetical protein [Williamsia soli]
MGSAGAAPVVSERFPYTHRTDFYCVPSGVTELKVTAVGGAGATYHHTGTGGAPGIVVGTFPVVPGTELAITVGQWGHESGGFGDGKGGRHGTSPGSSSYASGAGGGGSTAVKATTSPCGSHSLADARYLVVAGGGGGGGGGSAGYKGGGGGFGIGGPGFKGEGSKNGLVAGDGGCGGRLPHIRGCTESIHGGDGTDAGENGPVSGGGGGGGGGGYNGGGKGHGADYVFDGFNVGAGGGGGGGESYSAPTGKDVSKTAGKVGNYNGYVELSTVDAVTDPSGGSSDIVSGLFGSS